MWKERGSGHLVSSGSVSYDDIYPLLSLFVFRYKRTCILHFVCCEHSIPEIPVMETASISIGGFLGARTLLSKIAPICGTVRVETPSPHSWMTPIAPIIRYFYAMSV